MNLADKRYVEKLKLQHINPSYKMNIYSLPPIELATSETPQNLTESKSQILKNMTEDIPERLYLEMQKKSAQHQQPQYTVSSLQNYNQPFLSTTTDSVQQSPMSNDLQQIQIRQQQQKKEQLQQQQKLFRNHLQYGETAAATLPQPTLSHYQSQQSLFATGIMNGLPSLGSEQHLCMLYNNHQHSDYIISDYMDKISTRISLLETELKFAWRALDLLSSEYSKMWARLEKLANISLEQQSVVNNLKDLYVDKKEHLQPDCADPVPFGYIDDHIIAEVVAATDVEKQSLETSIASESHVMNEAQTSREFNSLLEELKTDALEHSTSLNLSPNKLFCSSTCILNNVELSSHFGYSSHDDSQLYVDSSKSICGKSLKPLTAACNNVFSDTDVLLYDQKQQDLLDRNVKSKLLREFINSRKVIDSISNHHTNKTKSVYDIIRSQQQQSSGSMFNLAAGSSCASSTNNLTKAHSFAHLHQDSKFFGNDEVFFRPQETGTAHNSSMSMNVQKSELDGLSQQLEFFRQVASNTSDGELTSVPINDSGGGTIAEPLNEMNENLYKTLNQAYHDDNLISEISGIGLFLQQSEAAHDSISGICSRPISSLGMIYEDNEEEVKAVLEQVDTEPLVYETIATKETKHNITNLTKPAAMATTVSITKSTSQAIAASSSKKSKKTKKKKYHKDEMDLLNNLKSTLAQAGQPAQKAVMIDFKKAFCNNDVDYLPTSSDAINSFSESASLEVTVDIIGSEITKIQQLPELSKAQQQKLRGLITKEEKFFKKIKEVDKNLIFLLLNHVTFSEEWKEVDSVDNTTNEIFEAVIKKLKRNIETFKKLVGYSFDSYGKQKEVKQESTSKEQSNDEIKIHNVTTDSISLDGAELSDYSAHLLRNNFSLNEQLKILEHKETEMQKKKTKDQSQINKANTLSSVEYFDNFLEISAEQERELVQDRSSDVLSGNSASSSSIYNNDEYIKSLKRSLDRHNSMLFLLHLQNSEYQNKMLDGSEAEIDMLLVDNESPPPPAPNNDMLMLLHSTALVNEANITMGNDTDTDGNLQDISQKTLLNPFHEELFQIKSKYHDGQQLAKYFLINQYECSPKKTKSDSGLSSMSGLSSWEKSPNSATSLLVPARENTGNPFLSKYQGSNINTNLKSHSQNQLEAITITSQGYALTPTSESCVVPGLITCSASYTTSVSRDTQKLQDQDQAPHIQTKHQDDYMFSEENLNYIRELSKNMPICSAYENKSIFSREINNRENMLDPEIHTIDDMLAWDHKQYDDRFSVNTIGMSNITNIKQTQIQNIQETNSKQIYTDSKMPDLLKTQTSSVSSANTFSRQVSHETGKLGYYEETDIDNVEMVEQIRNRNLTDRLVFYPSSPSIVNYNCRNNMNYLCQNRSEFRDQCFDDRNFEYGLGSRYYGHWSADSNEGTSRNKRLNSAIAPCQRHAYHQLQLVFQHQKKHGKDQQDYQVNSLGYVVTSKGMVQQTNSKQQFESNVTDMLDTKTKSSGKNGKHPKMWNKLTNLIPDNLKLKKLNRHCRTKSLSAVDANTMPNGESEIGMVDQSGTLMAIQYKRHIHMQQQLHSRNQQHQQPVKRHVGNLRSFDLSKRFNKIPLQVVRRSTCIGVTKSTTISPSSLTHNRNVPKSKKKRSLSATMNSFMQKAKTYRRHSFDLRPSFMSDPEAEPPSFTSSDNDESFASDYSKNGRVTSKSINYNGNSPPGSVEQMVETDFEKHETEISQASLFKQMSQLSKSSNANNGEPVSFSNTMAKDPSSLFPTIGTAKKKETLTLQTEVQHYKQKGRLPDWNNECVETSKESIEIEKYYNNIGEELLEMPTSKLKLLGDASDLARKSETSISSALEVGNRLTTQCLHKTHSICVEENYEEGEEFNVLKVAPIHSESFFTSPQQQQQLPQPIIAISNTSTKTYDNDNAATNNNKNATSQTRSILKLSQRTSQLSTQLSLDVPGNSFSSRDEEDNRSQHSYRTVSSSRRQSTEDSIDTDDEYFCYELRQLEKLEHQRLQEAEEIARAEAAQSTEQHLFSKIDELALIDSTEYTEKYQPDKNVVIAMELVLQELQYVVKRQPDINGTLETTAYSPIDNTSKVHVLRGVNEKLSKLTDIHSAWQDSNMDNIQQLSSNDENNVAAIDIDIELRQAQRMLINSFSMEATNINDQQKPLQQKQQYPQSQKRLKKRRNASRKGIDMGNEIKPDSQAIASSSSCSSDDDQRRRRDDTKQQLALSNDLLLEKTQRYAKDRLSGFEQRSDAEKDDGQASGATSGPDTPTELTEMEYDEAELGHKQSYGMETIPNYQDFKENEKQRRLDLMENQRTKLGNNQHSKDKETIIDSLIMQANISKIELNIVTSDTDTFTTAISANTIASSKPMKFISQDSSIEGAQASMGGNGGALGSSKWKLLKTLKEKKIEERNNQDKIKEEELTRDRDKNGTGPGDVGIRGNGHPGDNPFYSNIDSMPDIRPRRKSIPLVSELVCDHRLCFTFLNTKFPGATHDSGIWATSDLREYLIRQHTARSGVHRRESWLIGDQGYPLEPWLLTPVGAPNTTKEQKYNKLHSSARNCIERAFGVLKSRFRCLLKHRVLHYSHETSALFVKTCVILHNIMMKSGLNFNEIVLDATDECNFAMNGFDSSQYTREGERTRSRYISTL